MSADYKAAKEAFVSDKTGSSLTHVNLISAVALTSIILHHALSTRVFTTKNIGFPTAWLVLVLPLLLSVTIFANQPVLLAMLTLIPSCLVFVLISPRPPKSPLPSNSDLLRRVPSPTPPQPTPYLTPPASASSSPVVAPPHSPLAIPIVPLPALTTYRAHMLLMTTLCILAVDFPVFPRTLAKCESFGVSLMDIGVGSFVFSQGVVSAIPVLKDPAHLAAPVVPKLIHVLRKVWPVLLLGLVRVALVKGTQYPEHASEYGVHWNFFITLALLPFFEVFLHPVMSEIPISVVACLVAISYQIALSATPLQEYVLTAPRTNLFSANKEGIFSVSGNLAIHLLGFSTGTLLLPPSPSDFRRRQQSLRVSRNDFTRIHSPRKLQRQDDKTAIELFSYAVLWWVLLGVVYNPVFGLSGGVSRRLVNLPYILWVAAYNTSFILGYLLLDMAFFPAPPAPSSFMSRSPSRLQAPVDGYNASLVEHTSDDREAPTLLDAINRNGLVFFLLANVTTGLVNLSMQTMYATDTTAILVLSLYSLVVCGVAWRSRNRRLWIA